MAVPGIDPVFRFQRCVAWWRESIPRVAAVGGQSFLSRGTTCCVCRVSRPTHFRSYVSSDAPFADDPDQTLLPGDPHLVVGSGG